MYIKYIFTEQEGAVVLFIRQLIKIPAIIAIRGVRYLGIEQLPALSSLSLLQSPF